MKRLAQAGFAEPDDAQSLLEEPMVVHQRADPTTDDRRVIFVHGLGGSRFGNKSTWGNSPRFIFEDAPDLDLGMCQ
jgi:hypothetical protein